LTGERRRNAEVVEVLTHRANSASEQAKHQRVRIGELNAKVTELTGDNASLRSELKSRDLTISGLRETVRSRNTEIQMLRADLDLEAVEAAAADVHGLPRHLRELAAADGRSEQELWGDADHPTVVDMRAVEAVMPNLEVDQQRKRA
jgi:chromosome segregation ATPase